IRSQAPQTAMSPVRRVHHGVINFIVALMLFLIALVLIFVGKTMVLDKKELTPSNVVSSLTSTLEGVPGALSSLVPGSQPKLAIAMRAPVLAKAAAGTRACAASATAAAERGIAVSKRGETFAVRAGDPPGTDVASSTKTLYLTFDDGPSKNTQAVLDVLDRYGIKATFFVTGIDPDYAHMIKVAHDKGNTIGLHTYSHDYARVYASVGAYFDDLDAIGQVVREQIGYVPCFVRFPGGSSNSISANYTRGIMSTLSGEVQARGYQYYDWDASCGDGSVHTAEETEYFATEGCGAVGMQNVIMLLHDSATKDTTVAALPKIIEYWRAQGYEFAPIDRETRYAHHGIGN
ncbi:MAG: polysaccharide deacetylase, partial [Olsenella sp.]|nr:polysaccharide deacetylase [Olsenella sp.]